jgi:alpha-L-fucosidase
MDKYGFHDAHGATENVDWGKLARPQPAWFTEAKLGIMIHWGAYSVPAWAETTGELGRVDGDKWFAHNSYAEWYWNTIRFEDSPTREHHRSVYKDAAYDDFLDAWTAEDFDPAAWIDLFARCGARYVIPTTKHHDGITLWNAPGTSTRNTVARGPRKDLIRAIEQEVRRAGLRFGVYYSGGLDWSVTDLPAHDLLPGLDIFRSVRTVRPQDAAYAAYADLHVRDLIDRYRPDILWNDIEWPDAGKHAHSLGLLELFKYYYAEVPDGLVNDRWGIPHSDFRTSEYYAHAELEKGLGWENCRGIGRSFGYNSVEGDEHLLSPGQLSRHFVDIVSRGGNLLLNVGPDAAGRIPENQRRILERLATWMTGAGQAIHGSAPLAAAIAAPADAPWVRWTRTGEHAWAFVDGTGRVPLQVDTDRIDAGSGWSPDGLSTEIVSDGKLVVTGPAAPETDMPLLIRFRLR